MREYRRLKVLAVFFAFMVCGPAHAEKFDPEFEHYVKPLYPHEFDESRASGRVRIGYTVHNDGLVSNVRVVSRTDPRYANAAVYAVARWRFKPWGAADRPESVDWIVNFTFGKELVEEGQDA